MAPSWVLQTLFLLLYFTHASYDIDCGDIQKSSFLNPIIAAVSEFLHNGCSRSHSTETIESGNIHLATWPQYGNFTAFDNATLVYGSIAGYAYAEPACASFAGRRRLLHRLLALTLYGSKDLAPDASVPADWRSFSLAGAPIIRYGSHRDVVFHPSVVRTNRFGHFRGFQSHVSNTPLHKDGFVIEKTDLVLWTRDCRCENTSEDISASMETFYVGPQGLTIVSDVDDIVRVAEIWNPKQALLNIFVRPFQPWLDMPTVYRRWKEAVPYAHFHWLSDVPVMSYRFYVDGLSTYYPAGSFDGRSMDFGDFRQAISPRYYNLKRLMETFPLRKFVLVGDTTPTTAVATYVRIAREHPNQVQCIIIRDVSATDSANWMTPNLKSLRRLSDKYILFKSPAELLQTASLMQMIHDGSDVRCGGLTIDSGAPNHGALSALISPVRAFSMWARCNLFFWKRRPREFCPFDRRELETMPFRVPPRVQRHDGY